MLVDRFEDIYDSNQPTRTIMALYDGDDAIPEKEALCRTIIIWSMLHGMVNLFNSRVLQEVEESSEELIYKFPGDDLVLPGLDYGSTYVQLALDRLVGSGHPVGRM